MLWNVLLKKIHRSRTNKYVIPVRLHKSARLNNFKPSGLICYYFFPSVFLSFSLFHSRLNFIDRISWLSVLCKNKFPQIKITAQIFPAKTYSRGNTVCSNLNSLHKNTVPRNRVCSITTGLFFWETNTDAHLVLFENMYFYCTYSIKTKILSMLGTGYFLKSQKLIPGKKNQSVLIAKISSRKTQKIANPQGKLLQKCRSRRYLKKWSVVWSTRARSLFLFPYLHKFRFLRLPL